MLQKKAALEKEWNKTLKQEQTYIDKRSDKKASKLNQLLESKVPPRLQETLDLAFSKAFYLIFEKGTDIIEKTYNRDELEKTYQINEYTAHIRQNRKSLRAFTKKAEGAGNLNLLVSGVSGVGLGVLGIGIPDIILFTGLMLKGIYEIALSYGYDYRNEEEKMFILLLIQGSVSYGEELVKINEQLNFYMEKEVFKPEKSLTQSIQDAAGGLSKELLYMKFLQGIPVIGAVGGAYDIIYMKQVVSYAKLKYRQRFYRKLIHGEGKD